MSKRVRKCGAERRRVSACAECGGPVSGEPPSCAACDAERVGKAVAVEEREKADRERAQWLLQGLARGWLRIVEKDDGFYLEARVPSEFERLPWLIVPAMLGILPFILHRKAKKS